MTRLSPAVRLVIRIGSGLLVAAVIAIALTVPAPAFSERHHDHDGALAISAASLQAGSWPMTSAGRWQVSDHSDRWAMVIGPHCELSASSHRTDFR